MKKLISVLSIVAVLNTQAQTPCCYSDSYSSSTGWTINGTNLAIGPSVFTFSTTPDGAYDYATHSLNCTLSDSMWKGDVDFIYTGRGTGGVGHGILAVTSGTLNTWNTGGTSYTASNQNAIAVYINSPYNGGQATDSIYAGAKLGTTWGAISKGIHIAMGTQYYFRLERLSHTQGRVNVFTDAARTIHVAGSPQLFTIAAGVTGLNVAQSGNIPQGAPARSLTGTLDNLNICDSMPPPPTNNCCYTDNYASATPWTINGTGYTIGTNAFTFNATPDAAYDYATHQLSCTLSDTAWMGDVDFKYTGRGTGGVGHEIFGATAGALNAWNTGGTSYAVSNQNAIAVYINSPYNGAQTTDSIFAGAKLGTTWGAISKGIYIGMNTQYYFRLQRVSQTLGKISVFTNATRTTHVAGSPQMFPINAAITGLNVVQSGSIPQGAPARALTATLNNLNICDTIISGTSGIADNKKVADMINIYPNPNNGAFIIETNASENQSTIMLYDINGKLVLTQTLNSKTTIDAGNLNAGIYNLSLISNEGVVNKCVVIVR